MYLVQMPDFVASRYLNAHLKYPQLNETDKINWLDQAVKNRSVTDLNWYLEGKIQTIS